MKNIIKYKIGFFSLLLCLPFITMAQEFSNEVPREFAPHLSEWLFFGVVFIVIVTALFAIYKIMELIIHIGELKIYKKHGLNEYMAKS